MPSSFKRPHILPLSKSFVCMRMKFFITCMSWNSWINFSLARIFFHERFEVYFDNFLLLKIKLFQGMARRYFSGIPKVLYHNLAVALKEIRKSYKSFLHQSSTGRSAFTIINKCARLKMNFVVYLFNTCFESKIWLILRSLMITKEINIKCPFKK